MSFGLVVVMGLSSGSLASARDGACFGQEGPEDRQGTISEEEMRLLDDLRNMKDDHNFTHDEMVRKIHQHVASNFTSPSHNEAEAMLETCKCCILGALFAGMTASVAYVMYGLQKWTLASACMSALIAYEFLDSWMLAGAFSSMAIVWGIKAFDIRRRARAFGQSINQASPLAQSLIAPLSLDECIFAIPFLLSMLFANGIHYCHVTLDEKHIFFPLGMALANKVSIASFTLRASEDRRRKQGAFIAASVRELGRLANLCVNIWAYDEIHDCSDLRWDTSEKVSWGLFLLHSILQVYLASLTIEAYLVIRMYNASYQKLIKYLTPSPNSTAADLDAEFKAYTRHVKFEGKRGAGLRRSQADNLQLLLQALMGVIIGIKAFPYPKFLAVKFVMDFFSTISEDEGNGWEMFMKDIWSCIINLSKELTSILSASLVLAWICGSLCMLSPAVGPTCSMLCISGVCILKSVPAPIQWWLDGEFMSFCFKILPQRWKDEIASWIPRHLKALGIALWESMLAMAAADEEDASEALDADLKKKQDNIQDQIIALNIEIDNKGKKRRLIIED